MGENIYKPTKKNTLFGRLEKQLRLNNLLWGELSTYYLYRLCYLFFLGLLYIWNAHYHEKMLYKINQTEPIIDGLRVKYMGLQSSYMFNSKQSEVAKRVAPLGIYESKVPPYKIKSTKSK
ncbi:FtsL-like putative cell division protein [Cardinium endosymbiont of Tipula unca]|uniref:FtsL-like putative cell division protein n=1 Tax=Cardinium endosymbiont of Tipula unca TaxID=3066216 RepID=UPI0030D38513